MTEQKTLPQFKIFDLYDLNEVNIEDPGLKSAINLHPKLILKSHGRNVQKLGQMKVNIVERLMNKLSVAGHRGKKHKIILGRSTGKYSKNMKIVLDAFKLIEKKLQKNPIQVLVKAIENAAPRDEITVIEYGGARYPQAVDVSPLRRINLALRNITHGASDKAFNKKKTIVQGLAEEIIMAHDGNGESFALRKKNEAEKQADSAR
ncbi:30S ribosomal protein S7 [Candidatus Pacearchaeota archaeon]|jgi:small subunit ribosomal protein S7|nr:30S ribosomal protein S7 [Candidatus Pacearchaeota archaeon]|tara:strand:- start:6576 stop:7190 length:615 start_codon:yes stop_codon:yes gene_type:complete